MQIAIDQEFQRLIPPLLPKEMHQLEANILHDGCQEPLSIWQGLLIDGHNRLKICQQHDKPFKVEEIELPDREHVKLWIAERQLGRRNLSDDQRATVVNDRREILSDIAQKKKLEKARAIKAGGSMETTSVSIGKQQDRTRKTVAKDANVSERKLRYAQAIKKIDLHLYGMVRALKISLIDGKRLAALPVDVRDDAIKDVESGTDVRTAIRSAKQTNYHAKIAKTKPKALEGTYRIFYADSPWKYIGLNNADEYGHAERHYDCLDDTQLNNYKPGNGSRLVKDMADKDAVLFMWVPSPMLERCFPVIKAWGFKYKGSFVWDKVKHNMGHYNSVRHRLLLIATRGSCKPDIPKLIDSVQVIERSVRHSEKPEEFYRIIERMYDHGRKLELFARTTRDGWDADGNEV